MLDILIIMAINIAGFILIYIILKRRIDRSFASTELLQQIESEIDAVITELNRTTERNITLIEEKINSVNGVIKRADQRLTLMKKQEKSDINIESVTYSRPKRPVSVPPVQAEPQVQPVQADLPEPQTTGNVIDLPVQEKPLSQRERVILMHSQGGSAPAIASKLGIAQGEVDLIISLAGRTQGGGRDGQR